MKDLFKRREDLLPLTLAAAFAASGLLLFGPIQMYVANLTELWFPIIDVLWPSLIAFVLAWGALTAFGVVFKGWSGGYMSLLCGLGLALYVQGNFLPSDHGILNGPRQRGGAERHDLGRVHHTAVRRAGLFPGAAQDGGGVPFGRADPGAIGRGGDALPHHGPHPDGGGGVLSVE